MNEAFEESSGEIILILDADARIPPEYISTHVSCFSREDIEMIFTGFLPYNFKKRNLAHILQEIYFSFARDIIYSNMVFKMMFMGNGVFFRRETLEKIMPIDPETLVDDFSIAVELSSLGIKEHFSIHPPVYIQYVNTVRELWKQHLRWYYGGFKEFIKGLSEKNTKKIFVYFLLLFILALPFLFTALMIFYGAFWFFFGFYLILFVYGMFFSSQLFRADSKLSFFHTLVFSFVELVFEYLIILQAVFLTIFKKDIEWYKVRREKA